MKLAVTSKGKTLDAEVDPRFGRASFFIIVDTESLVFDVIDNSENSNAFKGAGIQAAVAISNQGAEALLTGYCGPKAFDTLEAAGIKVANDATGTVLDAVEGFKQGKYPYATASNKEAHW